MEEAIIALVRLHQAYTFMLAERLLTSPVEVKVGITLTPKGGVPVTVQRRQIDIATNGVAAGA